ncbi:MAG: DUF4907 domain-containing protein [Ginsengibacter sp.]
MFLSIQLSAQIDKQLPRQRQTANSSTLQGSNQFANSKFTYKIIDAPNKTFGYDIYADDRMMIHQPSIPGVPGNEGFKSKADAVKVGQLVIGKIKKGEMPPTVTIEEMKKLKVV